MSEKRFNGSVLMVSARSPFARRVRIAFREHGIPHEERIVDVFKPTEELIATNPLGRVPAVRLSSGEVIIDSNAILPLLYAESASPFKATPAEELVAAQASGLGVGLAEKVVEFFLEKTRPEGKRDEELLAEFPVIRDRVLAQLEPRLQGRSPGKGIAGRLTQADFDLGAALAYLTLRDSAEWKKRYPATAAYLDELELRPSFQVTRPPAA